MSSKPKAPARAPKLPRIPKPNGRPQALGPDPKTLATVNGLGRIQATTKESAAVMNVHEVTFLNFLKRYPVAREAFERGKEQGKASLRRTQIRLAENGSAAVAIFLGKNLLGQKDRHDFTGQISDYDLTKLSDKQLTVFESILSQAAVSGGDPEGEGTTRH